MGSYGTHDARQDGVAGMTGENHDNGAGYGGFENILQAVATCLEVDCTRASGWHSAK